MSRPVLALLDAERRVSGEFLGSGFVDVDGYVLAITPEAGPLMPNGIACAVRPRRGDQVLIGAGRLVVGGASVAAGPVWEPVPRPRVRLGTEGSAQSDPDALAGRGPGLTPFGDDVLAGFVAGLVLWGGDSAGAHAIAERAAVRTTSLSATLLRHAARGELPEPAHRLLECGDAEPLRRFGHSTGRGLMLGLALASPKCPSFRRSVAVDPPVETVAAGLLPADARVWIEATPS